MDGFRDDLQALGFRPVQERAGITQYALNATRYLTYWVHVSEGDGTALFTWEHAIGEQMDALGLQIGSHEPLNQFMYPSHDARGPQEIQFVVSEMDRVEAILRSVSFLEG
jgi:hypothetical protein